LRGRRSIGQHTRAISKRLEHAAFIAEARDRVADAAGRGVEHVDDAVVLGLFATELADSKKPGRIKRVYRPRDAMTPLDKLTSLPDAARFLRPGVTLAELQQLG